MRKMTLTLGMATFLLASCGASDDEKNKTLESAATMRAEQFCATAGGLEEYGLRLDYLLEQLKEEGLTDKADQDKALELYDQKIKASCPDKMPK